MCAFLKIKCDNSVVVMMMAVVLVFGATSVAALQPNSANAQVDDESQDMPVVSWKFPGYYRHDIGLLSITDTSMNLNPDERDTFEVKFWSEDDPVGIVIPVRETSGDSDKFVIHPGHVLLSDHSDPKNHTLHVFYNNSIWISYAEKGPFLLIEDKYKNMPVISWRTNTWDDHMWGFLEITDTSMNLNPDERDTFEVKFWSDSDPVGIVFPLIEKHHDSGDFFIGKEDLLLSDHSDPENYTLHVSDNDSIWISFAEQGPFLLVENKHDYRPTSTWHTVPNEEGVLGMLSITDTSMNLNPDERDTFEVKFWSEDDPVGIVIPVRETSSNSGKFEFYPKNVLLSDHFDSKENKLHVSEDHSVWMSYDGEDPLGLIGHFKLSHDNSIVNKPSPTKQLKWLQSIDKNLSGNLENIGCNSDLHLIQNTLTEKIACVKLFTMEKLIQRGDWRDVHSSMKHSDISNISISTDKSSYEIGSDMIVTIVDQSQNTDDHYADTINIDVLEWTVFSDSREILSVNIADDPIVFDPEPSWPRETGDDSDTFLIVMRVPEKIGDIMLEEGQQVRLTYNVEIPAVHVNPSVTFALTAECVSGKYSEEEQIKIKCNPANMPTS